VDITFPDLSGLAGWNAAYMPTAGTMLQWGFEDVSWNGPAGSFFTAPVNGTTERYNVFRGTVTP